MNEVTGFVIIIVCAMVALPLVGGAINCQEKSNQQKLQHERDMENSRTEHDERMMILQQALNDPEARLMYDSANHRVIVTQCGPDGLFGTGDDLISDTFEGIETDPRTPQTRPGD